MAGFSVISQRRKFQQSKKGATIIFCANSSFAVKVEEFLKLLQALSISIDQKSEKKLKSLSNSGVVKITLEIQRPGISSQLFEYLRKQPVHNLKHIKA